MAAIVPAARPSARPPAARRAPPAARRSARDPRAARALPDPVAATGLNPIVLATLVVWVGGVGVGSTVLRVREANAREKLAEKGIDASDIPDGSWGKIRLLCQDNGIDA